MRNIHTLLVILFVLSVKSGNGQTVSDLKSKYGEPKTVYSLSAHIWMSPDYTADGLVCQMRLYPKQFAFDTTYLATKLPFDELNTVINQLVPLETRGNKRGAFGVTATGGGAAWTTYPYETVTFMFVSPFKLEPGSRSAIRPFTFSEGVVWPTGKDKDPVAPGNDDFISSQEFPTRTVTITWNNRKCARQ